jgi:hypothetical protein
MLLIFATFYNSQKKSLLHGNLLINMVTTETTKAQRVKSVERIKSYNLYLN